MTDRNDEKGTGQTTGSIDWEKMMHGYFTPCFQPWAEMFQMFAPQEEWQSKGRVVESLLATVKMWQTMMSAVSQPSEINQLFKGAETAPGIALGFTQTCLQGMTRLQAQAGEWIQNRGTSLSAADMQELDRELIKNLTETYEKEFSRYLKLPQIGLSRLYQERVLCVMDKQNSLQLALSEFLHMLYLPIERSLNSLQKEMTEMAQAGPMDERSKTYYDLWIKLLEGHYMELFKEPEYADAMGNTLCALNEYVGARQSVINDILQQINIPTYQDIDDLSEELYLLKKRIRLLEK